MAQGAYTHDRPHANVGAIGHVDHSKITLTVTITKVLVEKYPGLPTNKFTPFDQVDNVPEEHQRGIIISVSHAEYETPNRHYVRADALGHADYIKNITTSTAQMDDAILAVATTGDLMTQAEEHILSMKQAEIPSILVVLSRYDSPDVDEDTLETVENEARNGLEEQGFNRGCPVAHVSALKALEGDPKWTKKIEELMDAVDTYILTPEYDLDKLFLVPIEDVFITTGRDTVVIGRVECGELPLNSEVEIAGIRDTQRTAVTDVEVPHGSMDEIYAGENCGLLLRGIEREDVGHGQVTRILDSVASRTKLEGKIYVLKKEGGGRHKSFCDGYRPQFSFRTTDVTGVTKLPEDTEMIMPGDTIEINVELIQSIVMEEGLGFAIHESDRTVGSGEITKIIE